MFELLVNQLRERTSCAFGEAGRGWSVHTHRPAGHHTQLSSAPTAEPQGPGFDGWLDTRTSTERKAPRRAPQSRAGRLNSGPSNSAFTLVLAVIRCPPEANVGGGADWNKSVLPHTPCQEFVLTFLHLLSRPIGVPDLPATLPGWRSRNAGKPTTCGCGW